MVRRERQLRRLQRNGAPANAVLDIAMEIDMDNARARRRDTAQRMASFHRQFGRTGRSPRGGRRTSSAPAAPASVAMTDRSPPVAAVSPAAGLADVGDRTERARRRVSTLLGHQPTVEDEEREQAARTPKWRKAVGTVFPGFR